ncbi:uncharacterized protein LOC107272167 isoform X2 [Cephus cinctus]|uniref:Uncharacterized protein LOC107272167 isoform X2 n=1 Tax=Cephus cinctus TaxID=211228 RepID=A0AAJ7RR78_CEPCN|nr:uncharacterized protein LOC107272167 isoform X2 [Cephus cinctus]
MYFIPPNTPPACGPFCLGCEICCELVLCNYEDNDYSKIIKALEDVRQRTEYLRKKLLSVEKHSRLATMDKPRDQRAKSFLENLTCSESVESIDASGTRYPLESDKHLFSDRHRDRKYLSKSELSRGIARNSVDTIEACFAMIEEIRSVRCELMNAIKPCKCQNVTDVKDSVDANCTSISVAPDQIRPEVPIRKKKQGKRNEEREATLNCTTNSRSAVENTPGFPKTCNNCTRNETGTENCFRAQGRKCKNRCACGKPCRTCCTCKFLGNVCTCKKKSFTFLSCYTPKSCSARRIYHPRDFNACASMPTRGSCRSCTMRRCSKPTIIRQTWCCWPCI